MTANLAGYLALRAQDNGWNPLPAYHVGDDVHTYEDVHTGAARFAAALAARGAGPGSRVLLALPDGIDLVRAFLGAVRLGAVAVHLNCALHPDELARAARLARPDLVVAESGSAGLFDAAVDPAELRGETAEAPVAEVTADTPAYAVFTSGTTGDPKLCFHAHGDPAVYEQGIGEVIGITPADVTLSVSRMYFAFGLANSLLVPLHRGGSVVLTRERATEDEALRLVRRHGVTLFYGQPSFYARLLRHPDHAALDGLRLGMVGGEVLPESLEVRVREVLGDRLLNVFGSTEIGHAAVSNAPGAQRVGTIGRVLPPYRVRTVDERGEPTPPGVEGLLEVAGPTIAPGVRQGDDPPARETGWYATGDAATVDEDGFVRLHGRVDDVEIVGGQNVHPTEIEDLLMRHPDVQEAGVCSVRRESGVTTLRAYVALKGGAARSERVGGELLDTAKQKLTWYKVPEDVVFVTALPRTPSGKLRRREVRALAG
ncbi:AMP-binding protein [Actinosynnema sp. NPDC050436]|uniref:AMP-binding protein n=1 Tax=Actinosynnema sp. NPDC050436 TaxID=3155659 RepID=UPI0033FDBA07